MDNYFLDREKTPKDEKGEYDFESLYAMGPGLFNSQLVALLGGDRVVLPATTSRPEGGRREMRSVSGPTT